MYNSPFDMPKGSNQITYHSYGWKLDLVSASYFIAVTLCNGLSARSCARQVQQAFGHHPGPGRELNVVNSVGVVGGAEVDDVQALGNHPTKTEPKNESLID